jgi:hypothetical protein
MDIEIKRLERVADYSFMRLDLKCVKLQNNIRTDKKRNTDIRQNLKIFTLREKIKECQQNYFENILRMPT